jgi:beta-N-acetylhexosaminidase
MEGKSVSNRRNRAASLSRRGFIVAAGTVAAAAAAGVAMARTLHAPGMDAQRIGGITTSTPSPTPVRSNLSAQQRLGQLFMVGLPSAATDSQLSQTTDAIRSFNAGNVVLYGSDWSSADTLRSALKPLQSLATNSNGGVGLFISGNQEGGQWGAFQAFYGTGFSPIPSAISQAQGDPATLRQQARVWGDQLLNAGVNMNLAPVLDTVPAGTEASNDPIGHWGREYGTTPAAVSTYGIAYEQGMRDAQIAVCIKHFPGLGRVTGNTDFTAEGIVDTAFTGANDPYVQPFKAGIDAGADCVMVSLAVYPQVDSQPAVFSPAMINGILRTNLGFKGVVITDDVGAAAAVADRTPAQRALDFLRAGGDMILTVQPTDVSPMSDAISNAMAGDSAFATQVNASIDRILSLKASYGLLSGV